MKILLIYFVTLVTRKCYSEFVPVFQPFKPLSAPLAPICPLTKHQSSPVFLKPILDNATAVEKSKGNLKFILPFLDMQIQSDRNLHVIQEEQTQQIYVLHGHELYQLFIKRQEKRLSLMGVLEGSVRHVEPLEAKIISLQGNLLLVIALDEHLEIYQLAEDVLLQRADVVKNPEKAHEPPPVFEAIQQLTLTGRFQKLFLFSPSEGRTMIVAAVNFTKLYGKLRTYEWFNTFFDPIEDITVPAMHVVNIIGSQTKYLITGRIIKHKPKTILTVYEISRTSLKLSVKQTLTVESRVVQIFSYQHRNMIVACSSKEQKCNSFRQAPDGHFGVYRQRTPKEFAFDRLTSSTRFIAASRQNQIMVFTNHRLDCYASFISDLKDVTNLMGTQNAHEEVYLLLIYNTPFKALVRIVELEINVKDLSTGKQSEPEESQVSNHHQHRFEQSISQLRSVLLQRKSDMDIFRELTQFFKAKFKDVDIKERTIVHAGDVGKIKIISESLNSPLQIMEKIESLKQNYLTQRSKRSRNQQLNNVTLDVTNRLSVQRIKVENLIYQGDVLEGFSLTPTTLTSKCLNIKPKVTTRSLNTVKVILPKNIRKARQQQQQQLDLLFDQLPSVCVNHLKVNYINGILWNDFYDSLFLKNRDSFIEGRLALQSSVRVQHLTVTILNGLVVSNLFNLKQPQIIHSDVSISRIVCGDLNAKTVNGLSFEDDIVFRDNATFVETPVIINHLRVSGDLFLANNTKVQRLDSNSDEIEFQQFYTNKVTVNGKLIVNNLKRLNNETKISLEDQEFNETEIRKKYLLKKQAQNFSFPVVFGEAKVTAPSLETAYLNDHPTDQHMLVNKLHSKKPLQVVFMNAQVKGDVILRDDYQSKIAEIKENIIQPGDKVLITGRKMFEAPLEVKNAQVLSLNELPASNLIFKSLLKENDLLQLKDKKIFSKIQVKNTATVDSELKASYLNNLLLENLLNNDYYMDRLKVDHLVNTSKLVFHKINGIPFKDLLAELDVQNERLVLHKDLTVEGNVQFVEHLNLEIINDINWNAYEKNLVRVNENAVIEGEVCFSKDLTITEKFESSEINRYDLETILKNILMKSQPQLITGHYHFDNLKASNMDALSINNVNVSDFMDLSKNHTEIEADITVENLNVEGNLQGNFKEMEFLLLVKEKIQQLSLRRWKSLYVLNNVSWPLNVTDNSQHELLKYIYRSAVLKNRNQIISGNVIMSKPVIKNMHTRFKFPANIDLEFIQQDAVLKNSSAKQIIRGEKVFLKSLHMEALKALKNVKTKFLNGIDVLQFNQSLYRSTGQELLRGPIQFRKPLKINHFVINGFINGLDPSGIYQLLPNSTLPKVQFHELYVENDLIIKNINDMNWSYFLNNRLTLQGQALEHFGHLTFENLIIEKEALVASINGIPIDSVVFKRSSYLQTITGHKIINNILELAGPAHVMHINNKDLMDLYHNSLHKHHNYKFNSLILEQADLKEGLQVVNDLKDNYLLQRSFKGNDKISSQDYLQFLKFLKEYQETLTKTIDYKDIIYLDYGLNVHVKWLDSEDHTTETNETIYHELSRISCCEKLYIQISALQPNKIYLKKLTSQLLTKSSSNIDIKAENFCLQQNSKMKSKITLTAPKFLKVFGLKRFIETVFVFENMDNSLEKFVILHALDWPNLKRNEIRILKISLENNSICDWQDLTQNVGLQLKFFKLSQLHIMLTNGLVDHRPALTIYHFQNQTQLFEVQQVIDGDYDIIEMLEVPNNQATKQLILSCSKCQRIFIYEFVSTQKSQDYEIQQIITMKSPIDKLLIFNLNKSVYMLVISQPHHGFYSVYKYSYIQGWLQLTFGFFPSLEMSLPLTDLWTKDNSSMLPEVADVGVPLMLLCKPSNCYVVKAFV